MSVTKVSVKSTSPSPGRPRSLPVFSCREMFAAIENNDMKFYNDWKRKVHLNNYFFADGSTLLTCAIRIGTIRIITFLLSEGADINLREKCGATPLLLSIYLNRFEMLQFLVKRGADIKARDSYGTPLTIAIRENNLQMVEFLIDNGASTVDSDARGFPPVIAAIKENNLDLVELVWKKVDALGRNVQDIGKNTPLIAAIKFEVSNEIINWILGHGANPNESKNEKTPLAWAAQKGNLEVMKDLLNQGANINILNKDGNTPLGTAVQNKQFQVAKFLIENNANICKFGEKGKTPLLWAILNEDLNMIKLLLDHGAEYIIDTVFIDAISTKNLKIVQMLNERERLNQIENKNKDISPLSKSIEVGSIEITKYLIEHGASVVDDLGKNEISKIIFFLTQNNFQMVKLLTEHGARIDELGDCGDTLLIKSVQMENFEMVKYFVAQGANVNRTNANGVSPLTIAESNKDFQTFQFLVDCGACVSEEDQAKKPKLARYCRVARRSSLRRENCKQEQDSGQGSED